MEFKRARTKKQVENRQEEILTACLELYSQQGFDGVTIKEIATRTSFSRPSIYNYYETKEEILLDLLQREYALWEKELQQAFTASASMDRAEFCHILTNAYVHHDKMLELITVNLTVIENKSRAERLCQFKQVLAHALSTLGDGLDKFFPNASPTEKNLFLYTQCAHAYGLYPITHYSKKQEQAMDDAHFPKPASFETLCYEGLLRLAARL
jgi:AcrR family transcriptional regulator